MAQSLKCDLCDKPATVHLTQILNNKIHKVDLCESCAQAKGVTDPNGFSLADMLAKTPMDLPSSGEQLKCEHCGFTQNDFRKLGRLGCPACYESFEPIIDSVLENMHKGVCHDGKIPQKAIERRTTSEKISILEDKLNKAVEAERYEDAARYRDEINALRNQTESVR